MTAIMDGSQVPNLLDAVPNQVARNITELTLGHQCAAKGVCDCHNPLPSYELWPGSLERFANVTLLHIYSLDRYAPLPFDSHHLFPALSAITFTFNSLHSAGGTEGTWWYSLRLFLSARKEAGRQLERVAFRGNALCHRACPGHEDLDEMLDPADKEGIRELADICL